MFLQKIIIILTSLIFVSATAFAQTTTSTSGKFTFLKKGNIAPFDGTLFDPVATAKILAEKEMAEKGCLLKSELGIEKKKNNLIINAQQEEIEALRNLAKGSDNTFWVAIGFVAGAVTSIAIFFAAVEITK